MADWSRLTLRLESSGAARLELSFAEIGAIIGSPVPASSQYAAFWSNSSSYARAWKRAGYETTRRGVLSGQVAFVRTAASRPSQREQSPPIAGVLDGVATRPSQLASARGAFDIVLVGCVKTKGCQAAPAKDLYLSPMFERRRRYAEESGKPWYILSAEHGLLDPGSIVEPYDVYLADQGDDYRTAWGEWVVAKLARVVESLEGRRVEIHASSAYVEAVEGPLRRRGAVVTSPLSGLRQGEQLSWYDRPAPLR